MKRNKYVYIGYRNLLAYSLEQEQAGGKPQNLDLRLCVSERGAYLLTYGGLDYAVSVERAEKFTAAANQTPAPAPAAPQPNHGNFCMYCGTPRNGNRFCSECGAEFQ